MTSIPSAQPFAMNATDPQGTAAIVQELERRKRTAADIILPANQITMVPGQDAQGVATVGLDLPAAFGSVSRYGLNGTAHSQTASKLSIPKPYYDRMLASHPDLLATNVNTWVQDAGPKPWLIRTLDGVARANLSDRYRFLDSHDLFFAAYDQAKKAGAQITRASLSDDRFEMRLIRPGWEREIQFRKANGLAHTGGRGGTSVIIPGAYVSNSETGQGGLNVKPFLLDLVCTNGMVGETAFRQVHLGGVQEAGYITAETRTAKDDVVWLEVRDLLSAVFDQDRFNNLISALEGTLLQDLAEPIEAVDAIVKDRGLSDDDRQAILNELISPSHDRDPGRTVYGLMSAITERAKFYADTAPERATDLEEAGVLVALNAQKMGVKIR